MCAEIDKGKELLLFRSFIVLCFLWKIVSDPKSTGLLTVTMCFTTRK